MNIKAENITAKNTIAGGAPDMRAKTENIRKTPIAVIFDLERT